MFGLIFSAGWISCFKISQLNHLVKLGQISYNLNVISIITGLGFHHYGKLLQNYLLFVPAESGTHTEEQMDDTQEWGCLKVSG